MKSFTQKVKKLLETTTNESIIQECNKILEFSKYNSDNASLRAMLLGEMAKIDEISDTEKAFLENEAVLLQLDDMGLKEAFEEIYNDKELLKVNPNIGYAINPLFTNWQKKQVHPIYIAEQFIRSLELYNYVPLIEKHLGNIKNIFATNEEKVVTLKTISYINGLRNNMLYGGLREKLYEYLDNEISRNEILNELEHFKFDNNLINSAQALRTFIKNDFILESSNKDFNVNKAYSFLYFDPDNMGVHYFANNETFFKKTNEKIEVLTAEEMNQLPQSFVAMNRFIQTPSVRINENKMAILLKDDRVEFDLNEDKKAYFNGREITGDNINKSLLNTIQIANASYLNSAQIIQKIWENLDNLIELDFVKNIVSNYKRGLGASVYKVNESFYLHIFDVNKKINEFIPDTNALQARNKLLEFIQFDLNKSLGEYIGGEVARINEHRNNQADIERQIANLYEQLNKIGQAIELDPSLEENEQIKELKEQVYEAIQSLKSEYNQLDVEIKNISTILEAERIPFQVKQMVKILKTGMTGQITGINTVTGLVTVLTDNGQTIDLTSSDIENVDYSLAKQMENVDKESAKAQVEYQNEEKEVKVEEKEEDSVLESLRDEFLNNPSTENWLNITEHLKQVADDFKIDEAELENKYLEYLINESEVETTFNMKFRECQNRLGVTPFGEMNGPEFLNKFIQEFQMETGVQINEAQYEGFDRKLNPQ